MVQVPATFFIALLYINNQSIDSKISCAPLYSEETTPKFLNFMLYSNDLKNASCSAFTLL